MAIQNYADNGAFAPRKIVDALRQAEPLCVKLHNYTKAGRKLQNLLCLHPIFLCHLQLQRSSPPPSSSSP